jgi:hypothetical protein
MKAKKTCEQIIKALVREGYRYQLSAKNLKNTIMDVRDCADERTVKRWTDALLTFGYLKRDTPFTFSINPVAVPELTTLLKEKPQTRMM